MNTLLKKTALLVALLLFWNSYTKAQKHAPVSHNPVKDAAAARTTLFSLPERDSNFYFRADLPGDNFLTIQFGRLSYWQEGSLAEIFATAKTAWLSVKDSFSSATSSRRLAVHIPPSGFPMLAAITEWRVEERTLLLKGAKAQPLRIAVDTIVVLKTLSQVGKDTGNKRQIQYTFLLKDLSEMEGLTENSALVSNVSETFDSLLAAKRKRWRRPDAPYHTLEAQYDVRNGISRGGKLHTDYGGTILDNFGYNVELGTGFIAGAIVPGANLRLSYNWFSASKATTRFLAVSVSALTFVREESGELKTRGLAFANLEIGSLFGQSATRIPVYRTSVGIGHCIAAEDEGPYDFRYRVFFNYSLSKAITLTPEEYIIPSKGEKKGAALVGLTVSVRLF